MDAEKFKRAENEYFRLKGMLSARRTTRAQFEQTLREMMIQDEQGRYWSLGVDDGAWYMNDGKSWVRANPYPEEKTELPQLLPSAAPTQAPPAAMLTTPMRSNALSYVAIGLGVAIVMCVGVAFALWFGSNSGVIKFNFGGSNNPPLILTQVAQPLPTVFVPPATIPATTPTSTAMPTNTPLPTPTFTPSPSPTITPRPDGNCADPNAQWENVKDLQVIDPYQAFIGTATSENFEQYVVEWLRPGNALYRSTTPVVHGQIFVWNTYTVANGEYQVALLVYLRDGTRLAPCVIRVRVVH